MSKRDDLRDDDEKKDAEREKKSYQAIFYSDDGTGHFPVASPVLIFPKAFGYPKALASAQNRRAPGQSPLGEGGLKDRGFPPVYAQRKRNSHREDHNLHRLRSEKPLLCFPLL